MKTNFTLLACLFFFQMLLAQQPWAPVGTAWYYTTGNNTLPPLVFSVEVESIDTIQGKPCSVFNFGNDEAYVYEDSNKVYVFNEFSNQFYPIYDFSLEVGDTMKVYYNYLGSDFLDSLTFRVDEIFNTQIEGKEVFTQKVSMIRDQSGGFEYSRFIYKGVGDSQSIFPSSALASPPPNIRCKIVPNDEENSYRFTDQDCASIISSTEDWSVLSDVRISPNPATSTFRIDMPEGMAIDRMVLTDFSGKTIWQKEGFLTDRNPLLLPPAAGIYFVSIQSGEAIVLKKIIRL